MDSDTVVSIARLWPTEGVVSQEAVQRATAALQRGEKLEPIAILEVDGRLLVRDGNNRVRAWIEYYANTATVPDIAFRRNNQPAHPAWEGPAIAEYCGQGAEAFLGLRKVPEGEYTAAQLQFLTQLRASVRRPG